MADAAGGTGAPSAVWPPLTYEQPVAGRPLTLVEQPGPDTQSVQASAEGVVEDDPNRIEFLGEHFRLAERIGLMPMLAFANASKAGLDSEDMAGLAAMYALIRDVVDQTRPPKIDESTGSQVHDAAGVPEWDGPSEWMRFERHAMDMQADGEELMDFVSRAMAVVAARPTQPRRRSLGTSPPTSEKSKAALSSPVMPPGAEGLTPVSALGR